MRIKKDDIVKVIAGNSNGVQGRVLSVDHKRRKLVVEGVNRVYKHVRRTQKNPQGGRLSKEMPIPDSNVMLICSSCGQPTRLGARRNNDGAKERFCRKCDAALGEIAPPREL
jgi:large subunit ribosomal protein L24